MSGTDVDCGVMMGIPCRDDGVAATYAMPVQSGFLYGIRDVDMGYLGDKQVAEESSSARLFEPIDDAAYEWSDGTD